MSTTESKPKFTDSRPVSGGTETAPPFEASENERESGDETFTSLGIASPFHPVTTFSINGGTKRNGKPPRHSGKAIYSTWRLSPKKLSVS